MLKNKLIFKRIFTFGLGIFIFLIMNLFITACSKSYKDYQNEFRELLKKQNETRAQEFKTGLKTISYKELNVRDNCVSCHLGIDDPNFVKAPQPFRTHPGDYLQKHDWQKIGCSICHAGNGSARTVEAAHQGMLQAELAQTTCNQCHPRNQKLESAPEMTRGKILFTDLQCSGCHYVKGLDPERKGPSLNGIGSRSNRKWLKAWLKEPHKMISNAKMPNFYLTDEYADEVAAYLMTFKDSYLDNQPEPPEGDIDEGGNILRRARCISCHPFNGRGGYLAPDLGNIGNRTNRKYLFYKIKYPRKFEPNSTMPQFNFTDQQIADVVDFLIDEYTDYDLLDEFEQDSTEKKTDSLTVDMGRRIYKELRCSNCHILNNNIPWMRIGPRLDLVGEKPLQEFNFGNSQIPHTREDYIFRKIQNPREFTTPSNPQKMPLFNLNNHDIYDLTLLLLSFNSKRISSPRFAAYPDTTLYQPEGEVGKIIAKFQCFSCHRINGRGYNLAYDLSIEGSRVQKKWLYDYLMVSYSIRPILVERMPIFNFTQREAKILTDYIMQDLQASWPKMNLESQFTPERIRQGKILFEEKGCMACHIRGDKGGYVGPSFTTGAMVGDKLQAEWIYQWLKNPQKIVPGVLEPNYNLSDEERLALTAYLMSLKK